MQPRPKSVVVACVFLTLTPHTASAEDNSAKQQGAIYSNTAVSPAFISGFLDYVKYARPNEYSEFALDEINQDLKQHRVSVSAEVIPQIGSIKASNPFKEPFLEVVVDVVRLRREPHIQTKSIGTLRKGEYLLNSGYTDGWYRVMTLSGKEGFVYGQLLRPVDNLSSKVRHQLMKNVARRMEDKKNESGKNLDGKGDDGEPDILESSVDRIYREMTKNTNLKSKANQCSDARDMCQFDKSWPDCNSEMMMCLISSIVEYM